MINTTKRLLFIPFILAMAMSNNMSMTGNKLPDMHSLPMTHRNTKRTIRQARKRRHRPN